MRTLVLDENNQPLMPTSRDNKVAWLLKNNKAKVVNLNPFTIKLQYKSKSYKQPISLGIDDGDKFVGLGFVLHGKKHYHNCLAGTIKLRQDIKSKMDQRRKYRRTRRYRLRRRPARWGNRVRSTCRNCGKRAKSGCDYCTPCVNERKINKEKMLNAIKYRKKMEKFENKSKTIPSWTSNFSFESNAPTLIYKKNIDVVGWLPPSIITKSQQILRTIYFLKKYIPINKIIYEINYFDFQEQNNPKITGIEYQQGSKYVYGASNFRGMVLARDEGKCIICGDTKSKKQAHHIIPRNKGGPDILDNGITLCHRTESKNQCHQKIHIGKIKLISKNATHFELINEKGQSKLIKKPKRFSGEFQARRTYMINNLSKVASFEGGFGIWTKHKRIALGFPEKTENKSNLSDHMYDALSLAINDGIDRKEGMWIANKKFKNPPNTFYEINPKPRHNKQRFKANYILVRSDYHTKLLNGEKLNHLYVAKKKNNENGSPSILRDKNGKIKWEKQNMDRFKVIIKYKKNIKHLHILEKVQKEIKELNGFKRGDIIQTNKGKAIIDSIKYNPNKNEPDRFGITYINQLRKVKTGKQQNKIVKKTDTILSKNNKIIRKISSKKSIQFLKQRCNKP